MPHFFRSDILGLFIAVCLGIPIICFPGYLFGWTLDLLGFRREAVNSRWGLATLFGLGLLPILLYLSGRLGSADVSLGVLISVSVAGLIVVICTRGWPRPPIPLFVVVAVAAWIGLASLSLLDVAVGAKLYPSSAIIDHSYRSQVIASIAFSDRLPPTSFFFFPGHAVGFHYHYFLFLIGAAMMKFGGGLVSARIALIALTIWAGFSLLAMSATYVRKFLSLAETEHAVKIAWVLLVIGGLDIVPFATLVIARILTHKVDALLFPSVEWWNSFGEVFGWYDSVIWQPHHIAGLVSCFLGALLLWDCREATGRKRLFALTGAALAFASGTGSSVLVTAVFAVFFGILVVELLLNDVKHLPGIVASATAAGFLLLPFIYELKRTSAKAGLPLSFDVRPFAPVTLLLSSWKIHSPLIWNISFLLALPLNYFLELGLFFVLGMWWILDARKHGPAEKTRDHMMIGLASVSLLLSSFVYIGSSHSNDFGYRAMLPAQFILLLWSVVIIDRYWSRSYDRAKIPRSVAGIVYVTLSIGLLTTVADIVVLRSRVAVAEASGTESVIWPQSSHPAEMIYQLRAAYTWIRHNSPANAVVQQNPEPYFWLEKKQYSERMAAVQGSQQDDRSGGTSSEFKDTLYKAESLFTAGTNVGAMQRTCSALKLDYVVVQNSDPVWQDKQSYVWSEKPAFDQSMVKIFPCSRTVGRSIPIGFSPSGAHE